MIYLLNKKCAVNVENDIWNDSRSVIQLAIDLFIKISPFFKENILRIITKLSKN
jgi:hypothetical protein